MFLKRTVLLVMPVCLNGLQVLSVVFGRQGDYVFEAIVSLETASHHEGDRC